MFSKHALLSLFLLTQHDVCFGHINTLSIWAPHWQSFIWKCLHTNKIKLTYTHSAYIQIRCDMSTDVTLTVYMHIRAANFMMYNASHITHFPEKAYTLPQRHTNIGHICQFCCLLYAWHNGWKHKYKYIHFDIWQNQSPSHISHANTQTACLRLW